MPALGELLVAVVMVVGIAGVVVPVLPGLFLVWAAGIVWGSWTAWSNGLKPLATIDLGGASYVFYVGLGALILNVLIAAVVTLVVSQVWPARRVPT